MIPPTDDLDALLKRLTSPTPGASGATSCSAPSTRSGPTATSSRCSSPRRSPTGSRRGSRGSRGGPTSPFSRPSTTSTSPSRSTVRLPLLGSALSPDFVTEGRSLILTGKPGRGKTHLAVAIAYRAIQNGFDAYFTTAAALIDDLSAAFRAGHLAQALPDLHASRRPGRRRGRLPHLRHGRRQHALPRRQRAAPPHALDDLHHQQVAQGLGPRPARRRPRPRHRRPRPRARAASSARRALDPHAAPEP